MKDKEREEAETKYQERFVGSKSRGSLKDEVVNFALEFLDEQLKERDETIRELEQSLMFSKADVLSKEKTIDTYAKLDRELREEHFNEAAAITLLLQQAKAEINKIVLSVGEWSALAIDRKQDLDQAKAENEELKEGMRQIREATSDVFTDLQIEELLNKK